MTTLRTYIRGLSRDQRQAFASEAGTSVGYLEQLAYGHRRPSAELAKKLEAASGNALDRMQLLFPEEHEESAA